MAKCIPNHGITRKPALKNYTPLPFSEVLGPREPEDRRRKRETWDEYVASVEARTNQGAS